MEKVMSIITDYCVEGGMSILLALVAWVIGKFIIKAVLKTIKKSVLFKKQDKTVADFIINMVKAVLYIVLIICVVGIIGVPMASIAAVLASAGVAIGLALQGGLSNVAGSLMIMVFRPFGVGDYISAADAEGSVVDINLFYTVLNTPQNARITVPNGSLMNANVINYSANENRRIDLTFNVGKDCDLTEAMNILREAAEADQRIAGDPAPWISVCNSGDNFVTLSMRVWVNRANVITTKEDLLEKISMDFKEKGITAPAVRVISESN